MNEINLISDAPNMIGIDKKKEYSVAADLLAPNNNADNIVTPDLLVPGIIDSI